MSKINLVKGLVAPDAPSAGQISIFSLTDGELYTRNDNGTIELLSGLGGLIDDPHPALANNLDADTNRVINLSDPTLAQDAATKNYVDTEITNLGVGTLLSNVVEDTTPQLGGNLDVNGFRLTSVNDIVLNANDNVDVMLSRIINVSTPTAAADAANKSYVDGLFASASMSGIDNVVEDTTPQLGGNLDAQTNNITDVGLISLSDNGGNTQVWQIEEDSTGSTNALTFDYNSIERFAISSTGNVTLSGTVDGRNVSADGIKLDGIEVGATADQNASEVPFTPTGSITSSDVQSAIDEINTELTAHIGSGGSSHAAATTSVSGFMSAVDKTKLDGVESGATADQTDAEIKTAYENNANTNAFTDAEQAKLTGIESGATTDQSASEVPFSPGGTITSTNVQDAIDELDTTVNALPGGTVTSVGSGVGLSGGPITTTGTLNLDFTTVTPGSSGVPSTEVFVTAPPAAPPASHVVRPVGELAIPSGGFLMSNLVDDTTPTLGGNLDLGGFNLNDTNGNEFVVFVETGSAVNELWLRNAATGTAPALLARGDDTNVDLDIEAKGSGSINLSNVNVGTGTTMTRLLSATAALDFPSMSDGQEEDLTITVTGAVVGDSVALGTPAAPTSGVVFTAFVSAADTVTVRASNFSGTVIDPTSGTFRATVFQF